MKLVLNAQCHHLGQKLLTQHQPQQSLKRLPAATAAVLTHIPHKKNNVRGISSGGNNNGSSATDNDHYATATTMKQPRSISSDRLLSSLSSLTTKQQPIMTDYVLPPSSTSSSLSSSSSSFFSTTATATKSATSDDSSNTPPPVQKGFFQRIYDRFSLKGQNYRIRMAESFYQAAIRQASDPRWFGPGRIGREFRTRHALITLHVWLLHKRLISDAADPQAALLIQEQLFDILWNDTTCRIRREGVSELTVNKHLKQVQQYTFLHLFHYDHIYTPLLSQIKKDNLEPVEEGSVEYYKRQLAQEEEERNPKPVDANAKDFTILEERISELKKLVWMHILVKDDDKQIDDHLERMAWYIEAQYQNIMHDLPEEYYRDGRVAWIDLPDFSNLVNNNGSLLSPVSIHPEDVLPQPWLENITLRGEAYYWNPETMESTWEKPTLFSPNKQTSSSSSSSSGSN